MYIINEILTTDGVITSFTLDNKYKAGSLLITYNDSVFYEFLESSDITIELDFAPEAADSVLISYYTFNTPFKGNASRYASVQQVKASSKLDLSGLTDSAIEGDIRDAERYIDAIVGEWKPSNETQQLTFPRHVDVLEDYYIIPPDINRAAIYAFENIYLAGTQTEVADGSVKKSEKLGDYSYTKEGGMSAVTDFDYNKQAIGAKAAALVYKYIRRIGNTNVTAPLLPGNLNSRQKWVIKNK
jgi:hypothetical protein